MKKYDGLLSSALAAFTVLGGIQARGDEMASVAIAPATGVVTLVPRWAIGGNLAGFHHMAQDLSLGGAANNFYSIKGTTIPAGGDISAFTLYTAGSGAAANHADIGSKLTPDSYSALTSADPDIGYGSVNFYFIHHKSTGDYFTAIVPGSGTSSAVTDLKPMSGPGGPATLGASGYFGLTFAAANLGYGLNRFYYLRTDSVTGFTKFGTLDPPLLGTSADLFDLGIGGYQALAFTGTDVGYGTDKMYYLRLDPITGFSIFGTLHPLTGRAADIANLGSVYSTLTFVPGNVGFGSTQFYTTGAVNPTWQSVSFAAIAGRALTAGSFTVAPSASSGLPITLSVVTGSASISGPVGGVFTVTPTAPGLITLQATQAGQVSPTPYEFNMLRQSFLVSGDGPDFNNDGQTDILWNNTGTGDTLYWYMNGIARASLAFLANSPVIPTTWKPVGTADFDNDGELDILWQNDNGTLVVWFMSNTTRQAFALTAPASNVGLDWKASATGDFNGDGKADIAFRNGATGQNFVWYMDGTRGLNRTGFATLGFNFTSSSWKLVGAADFNGSGTTDVLWQDAGPGGTGKVVIWFMTGATFNSYTVVDTVGDLAWKIRAVGDYNDDGKADIIFHHETSGALVIWYMNGSGARSGVAVLPDGPVTGGWQIGGPR